MTADPMRLIVLTSVVHEMEAAAIANALVEHGVDATFSGEYTSGFRVEAPGLVQVMIHRGDLARALNVLAEIDRENQQIEWPEEEASDDSTEKEAETENPPTSKTFQFSIMTLVLVQTVVCITLGLFIGFGAAVLAVVVFSILMLVVVVVSTVSIASDMDRTRKIWRPIGLVLITMYLLLFFVPALILILLDIFGLVS